MRRWIAFLCVAVLAAPLGPASAQEEPAPPGSPQERSVDPVVLTGAQFPGWSAGPDPTVREPQPLGVGADPHCNEPEQYSSGGRNCSQGSRLPRNSLEGVPTDRLLGYRWTGTAFEQIPFQVDERFTRYISNEASGFAFYSGLDQHNTYAFHREGFRYTFDDGSAERPESCFAQPKPGSPPLNDMGYSAEPDPVRGLDDDDELVFMYDDTGEKAPPLADLPPGIEEAREIAIADPTDPTQVRFTYVMLAAEEGPEAAFDHTNGYVRYARDANADIFVYSQSSYGNYGAAPPGPVCTPDGGIDTARGDNNVQRRPLDTAWVKTPRYAFRYDGRWLMTQIRVSEDDSGLDQPGLEGYGPDIIDRWKARAFAQDPSSNTPCCGYEEEDTNWGGSSILMGEKWGPVRAIRETWGADSATNNVRREVFYRDKVVWGNALRVHPIPPLDGIYVQWDYAIGKVDTYYNPMNPDGVAIDGQNDEIVGNFDDPCNPRYDPNTGNRSEIDETYRRTYQQANLPCNSYHLSIDVMDPTFSTPGPGSLQWEQVDGPHGAIVSRWDMREFTPGGAAQSLVAVPYYRDDSCFDDGTGHDPGPKLNLRSGNEQAFYWETTDLDTGVQRGWRTEAQAAAQPNTSGEQKQRKCWEPDDELPDPSFSPLEAGDIRYYQGSIGTHGLHLVFVAESDNAHLTVPVTEITSEQRMVILPGGQGNVGERYGRSNEFPLRTLALPFLAS